MRWIIIFLLLNYCHKRPSKLPENFCKVSTKELHRQVTLAFPRLQHKKSQGFTLYYHPIFSQPALVIWNYQCPHWLQKLRMKKQSTRSHFYRDPQLKTIGPRRYLRSGFDKGHIATASDFKFSEQQLKATFSMANISPQRPYFNRHGLWRASERYSQSIACTKGGSVQILAGPILSQATTEYLHPHGLAIAQFFYKVILHRYAKTCDISSMILPHTDEKKKLSHYLHRHQDISEKDIIAIINSK